MNLYDFPCEYCDGTVRQQIVPREPVSHHRGIVVLEDAPIGICDHCGAHYYAATVLKRVESILASPTPPARTLQIPVEAF